MRFWETVGNPSESSGPDGITVEGKRKKANPTNHFSHLFNAYAKYINQKYHRHGSLFQRPFKRKLIDNDHYLQQVVLYIHNNPVHHGFLGHPEDYPWSSHHTLHKPTKLLWKTVLDWFDELCDFKKLHQEHFDHTPFEAWLEDD